MLENSYPILGDNMSQYYQIHGYPVEIDTGSKLRATHLVLSRLQLMKYDRCFIENTIGDIKLMSAKERVRYNRSAAEQTDNNLGRALIKQILMGLSCTEVDGAYSYNGGSKGTLKRMVKSANGFYGVNFELLGCIMCIEVNADNGNILYMPSELAVMDPEFLARNTGALKFISPQILDLIG